MKTLKQIREAIDDGSYLDNYEQKTEVGKSFVALHRENKGKAGPVLSTKDRNGNGDDVFKGTNVATYDRERYGRKPGSNTDTGFPGENDFDDYRLRDGETPSGYQHRRVVQDEETNIEEDLGGSSPEPEGENYGVRTPPVKPKGNAKKSKTDSKVMSGPDGGTGPQLPHRGPQEFKEEFLDESKFRDTADALGVKANAHYDKSAQHHQASLDNPEYSSMRGYHQEASRLHCSLGDCYTKMHAHALNHKIKQESVVNKGSPVGNTEGVTGSASAATGGMTEMKTFLELREGVSRKHFKEVANTVRSIEDPKKRQEFADHHAAIFAGQNPRFSHEKFHEACGTQCRTS